MLSIVFICHGNICRSPMAEAIFRDMIVKAGISDRVEVSSAATSSEELGNGVYFGTRKVLDDCGISYEGIYSTKLTKKDGEYYDYLICMDSSNVYNARRITGVTDTTKLFRILELAGEYRDVADPWYSGDFVATYNDIKRGLDALLKLVKKEIR